MNRDKWQGFLCGFALAAAVLCLGGMVRAAGRTITVDGDIHITINGVPFIALDASGQRVPVFIYNGTTYVPLRAVSEAAGMIVGYDEATNTAALETQEFVAAADPNRFLYITSGQAKSLALTDAGVDAGNAVFLKSYLRWEDGLAVYDVEFCAGEEEYDYTLSAVTGKVLEMDYDCESYDWAGRRLPDASPSPGGRISLEQAKETALKRLPGALVRKYKLTYQDGVWKYDLQLRSNGKYYECSVDAVTGAIIKWQAEDA